MYSLSQILTAYFRGLIFSLMQFPLLSLAQQPIRIWLSADIHLMLNILTVLEYLWTTPCGCLTSVWLSSQTRLLSLTDSLLQLVAPCPICHSRYKLPLPPTLTFHQSSVPTIFPLRLCFITFSSNLGCLSESLGALWENSPTIGHAMA